MRQKTRYKSRPKRPAPPVGGERIVEAVIDSLGARGDGVARLGADPLFVPGTLPGELVRVRVEGKRADGMFGALDELLSASSARIAPVCPHFGTCGGCALQHAAAEVYGAWKEGLLQEALARQGLADPPLKPLIRILPGTRRRASFAFRKGPGGMRLGFNARASHEVVDIQSCAVLDLKLAALLPPLRALLGEILPQGAEGDAFLQDSDTGLDLLIAAEAPNRKGLDLFLRERLAAFATSSHLARLSWRQPDERVAEPVAALRTPMVNLGPATVELPPGAFLQPSREGEAALVRLVLEAVGNAGPVADLFAGLGSFALPLAQAGLAVHAVEGDGPAVAALKRAAERACLTRLSTEERDLVRRPLSTKELEGFNTVVFDPPRAGAKEQAAEIAQTKGPAIAVAVSCNPATLARDLKIFVNAGWRLDSITPVDQFSWSPHLEAVAVLKR